VTPKFQPAPIPTITQGKTETVDWVNEPRCAHCGDPPPLDVSGACKPCWRAIHLGRGGRLEYEPTPAG